jgi:hypothetical protein
MSETPIREEIVEAIDDIRRPPGHLVAASMSAVRADRSRHTNPNFAGAVAVLITAAVIAVLIGVSTLRHTATSRPSSQPLTVGSVCSIPVGTDQGPGLVELPSGVFRPTGLPAASATAYNPATHKWLATEPQGVSPDGKIVALLDNAKGHNQTLRLETSTGTLLYLRINVMRILGWSSDGSLMITTVDSPARLLKIAADGRHADWIDPVGNETTMWSFARGQYAWGVALPYPDADQHREVVRLDLATNSVSDWYAMLPGTFNDGGYGPIPGLTSDGYPIVPQLKTDSRSAIYVIRAKDTPTPVYLSSGDEMKPNLFWPEDAVDGKSGLMVTTTDGELYASLGSTGLSLVQVSNSVHVYSFAGGCA